MRPNQRLQPTTRKQGLRVPSALKVVITYQGKTYTVEDYYRNAWLGIDKLAKQIGEMSYAELK